MLVAKSNKRNGDDKNVCGWEVAVESCVKKTCCCDEIKGDDVIWNETGGGDGESEKRGCVVVVTENWTVSEFLLQDLLVTTYCPKGLATSHTNSKGEKKCSKSMMKQPLLTLFY